MVKHFYGDIEINWKDGEWERLQAIKARKDVQDVLEVPHGEGTAMSINVPRWLRDKIKEYAGEYNMTISEFTRNVLYIVSISR